LKKVVLELPFMPSNCTQCVLSIFKRYDDGFKGLVCGAYDLRMECPDEGKMEDCPLKTVTILPDDILDKSSEFEIKDGMDD
jgi:hypothetical protein